MYYNPYLHMETPNDHTLCNKKISEKFQIDSTISLAV